MLMRYRRLRREQRGLYCYHLTLRAVVVCLLGWKLLRRQWGHAGLCALTLALFGIPTLAELAHFSFPPLLEIIVTLFAAGANIGGEMFELYLRFSWWDSMLHILWGFLGGVFGYAFLKMAQKQELTPLSALIGALGFSALTSVCWEFFEYFMDVVFHMDMQKSAWLTEVSSILLNPEGTNRTVTMEAQNVLVNGAAWPGLLDIGLKDTMGDLWLNFVGSVPAALLAALGGKSERVSHVLCRLMPTRQSKKGSGNEKD